LSSEPQAKSKVAAKKERKRFIADVFPIELWIAAPNEHRIHTAVLIIANRINDGVFWTGFERSIETKLFTRARDVYDAIEIASVEDMSVDVGGAREKKGKDEDEMFHGV